MKKSACVMQSRIDAHFAGTIALDDERTMRAHLGTCEGCRARYRRQRLLAKLDPQALSVDVRIAHGLGIGGTRSLAHFAWPGAAALLAAAAAVILMLRPLNTADKFSARGLNDSADAGIGAVVATPALHIYRVAQGGGTTPVFDTLRRDDELAFAYENHDRKKYLMIFGVNERGRVYWFYPGWSKEADNPRAVATTPESGLHELPDAIVHRFEGSTLEIHSLFVDEPMTVREIEKIVATGPLGSSPQTGPLAVPEGIDHTQHFRMVP